MHRGHLAAVVFGLPPPLMLAFILRRLLQALVVMLTVAFLAFMLFQYVGDPVTSILGQDATQEQRDQLRQDLGLDAPFPVQFARFVGNAVQGEFGDVASLAVGDEEMAIRSGRGVELHGDVPVHEQLHRGEGDEQARCGDPHARSVPSGRRHQQEQQRGDGERGRRGGPGVRMF